MWLLRTCGRGFVTASKRIFDALHASKDEIEQKFGGPLSWERLDERQGSRVRYVLENGGLTDEDKWTDIQDAMIAAMEKLSQALKPRLSTL